MKKRGVLALMGIESYREGVLAHRPLLLPILVNPVLTTSYWHKGFSDQRKLLCSSKRGDGLLRTVMVVHVNQPHRYTKGITDRIKGSLNRN